MELCDRGGRSTTHRNHRGTACLNGHFRGPFVTVLVTVNCDKEKRPRKSRQSQYLRGRQFVKRRGGDSNPRYLAVHIISNDAHSATLPPLRVVRPAGIYRSIRQTQPTHFGPQTRSRTRSGAFSSLLPDAITTPAKPVLKSKLRPVPIAYRSVFRSQQRTRVSRWACEDTRRSQLPGSGPLLPSGRGR